MKQVERTAAAVLAIGLLFAAAGSVFAQQQDQRRQQGMGEPGRGMVQQGPQDMWGPGMGPGMMGRGYGPGPGATGPWQPGPHMMAPEDVQEMMEHMFGMMGPGMWRGMGPGMGPGMRPRMGGWLGLEGRRVVPMVQLSTDDVRAFFERYLEALGNERLEVGEVVAVDDDTIAADVVTVDDSLVERFEVDRHTGVISAAG